MKVLPFCAFGLKIRIFDNPNGGGRHLESHKNRDIFATV